MSSVVQGVILSKYNEYVHTTIQTHLYIHTSYSTYYIQYLFS